MSVQAWVAEVVRDCYRLDGDERQWLGTVTTSLRRGLRAKRGALACFFQAGPQETVHPWGFVMQDSSLDQLDAFLQICAHNADPLGRRSQQNGEAQDRLAAQGVISFAAQGSLARSWGLYVTDSPSTGCVFLFLDTEMPLRVQQRWDRIAPHVAKGLRLRRQRSDWFEMHRRGVVAWPALRQLAIQANHALGNPPTNDLWQGFMRGQWLLLHHFAHQGRRYIVARRTDPSAASLLALTRRETQVVALALDTRYPDHQSMALAIGSTESTISTHLARAMKKLGVHSRAELLAVLQVLSSK